MLAVLHDINFGWVGQTAREVCVLDAANDERATNEVQKSSWTVDWPETGPTLAAHVAWASRSYTTRFRFNHLLTNSIDRLT